MNEPTNQPGDDALDDLFAQARALRPDTSAAEYAFETRLMARLRETRAPDSIWVKVSWRMIPFFAACVVALMVWQSHVVAEAEAAEQLAYVENPNAFAAWNNL